MVSFQDDENIDVSERFRFLNDIETPFALFYQQDIFLECAKSQEIIAIEDAYADARFNIHSDKRANYRTRSLLAGPILQSTSEDNTDKTIALIYLSRTGKRSFTAKEKELHHLL